VRKLSIIVPVLGRLEHQENTLVSVLQNRPDDTEVLVVLNRPYADPYDLAGEVRFLQARRRAGLVECLNLAIRECQAPLVHVLACGVEAVEGWTASPLRHFRDPQVAAVAPLLLSTDEPRHIVAAGVGYSRGGALRLVGQGRAEGTLGPWTSQMLGPSLLAGFYRKAAIEAAGGFDASLGRAADIDLAMRLRASGHRLLLDPQSKMQVTADCPLAARGFRAGLEAERLFLRHVPEGRWIGALAAHLGVMAGDFFRALPGPAGITTLLGRAAAWLAFSGNRRRHRELALAVEASASHTTGKAVPRPHIVLAPGHIVRDAA
jgi:hypothetical protein